MTVRRCYVCQGYLFTGVRHRSCEPRYRRVRLQPCSACGGPARGERHRRCGTYPVGYRGCGYCGEVTRGQYHKRCSPLRAEFNVFPDLPEVVQRRCIRCLEWFPFAGPGVDAAVEWSPHGQTGTKRLVFDANCRACLAAMRRERAA